MEKGRPKLLASLTWNLASSDQRWKVQEMLAAGSSRWNNSWLGTWVWGGPVFLEKPAWSGTSIKLSWGGVEVEREGLGGSSDATDFCSSDWVLDFLECYFIFCMPLEKFPDFKWLYLFIYLLNFLVVLLGSRSMNSPLCSLEMELLQGLFFTGLCCILPMQYLWHSTCILLQLSIYFI